MCSQELREELQYWRILFKRREMEQKFQQQELHHRSRAHLYFAACLGVWAVVVMIYEIVITQNHQKPLKFFIFYSICTTCTVTYILLNRVWPTHYNYWHWLFVCSYSLNIAWSVYDCDFVSFDNKKTFSYGLYSAILICCYIDGGTFIPKVALNTILCVLFIIADADSNQSGQLEPRNILRGILPISLIVIKIRHDEFIKREIFLEKTKLEDMMSIIKNQIPLPFIIAKLNKRESKMHFHFGNLQAERQLGISDQNTYEKFMDNCYIIKQQQQQQDQNNHRLHTQQENSNNNNNNFTSMGLSQLPSIQLDASKNTRFPHPNCLNETQFQHPVVPHERDNSLRCLIRRKVETFFKKKRNHKPIRHQQSLQLQSHEAQNQQQQHKQSTETIIQIKDQSLQPPLPSPSKPKIITQLSTDVARANTSMTLPSTNMSNNTNYQTRGILLDKKRSRLQSFHGSNVSSIPRRVSMGGQTQTLPTTNNISQTPIIFNNEKSIILEEEEPALNQQAHPPQRSIFDDYENSIQVIQLQQDKQLTFLNDDSPPYENIFTLEPNNDNNTSNKDTNTFSNQSVEFAADDIHLESIQLSEFASTYQGINNIYANDMYQLFKPQQILPFSASSAPALGPSTSSTTTTATTEKCEDVPRKISNPRPNQSKLSTSSFNRYSPKTQITNHSSFDPLSPLGIRPKTSTFIFPSTPNIFSTTTEKPFYFRSPFAGAATSFNTSTSQLILEKHKNSNSDMSYINNIGQHKQPNFTPLYSQSSPKRRKKSQKTTTATSTTAMNDNEGEDRVEVEHSTSTNASTIPKRYAVKYRMFRTNEIFVAFIFENESYKKKYKHEKLKNQLLSDIRSHQHCLVQKSLARVSSILDHLASHIPDPTSNNTQSIEQFEKHALIQHSQALTELLACLLSMNLLHHTFILFNSFLQKSFPTITAPPSSQTDRMDLTQLLRSIASSLCCEARMQDKIILTTNHQTIIQQNAFLLKVLVFTILRYFVQHSSPSNSKLYVNLTIEEPTERYRCSSKEDCSKEASDRESKDDQTIHNSNKTPMQQQSQIQDQFIRIEVRVPFNEKLYSLLESKDLFVFSFDQLLKDELSGDPTRQSMWILRTSCQIVSLLGPYSKLQITKDISNDTMTVSFLVYRNLNILQTVIGSQTSTTTAPLLKPISFNLMTRLESRKKQDGKLETPPQTKSIGPFINKCVRDIPTKPAFEFTEQISQEFK